MNTNEHLAWYSLARDGHKPMTLCDLAITPEIAVGYTDDWVAGLNDRRLELNWCPGCLEVISGKRSRG